MNDCVYQKYAREEKWKAQHVQQRGGDGGPGAEGMFKAKEKVVWWKTDGSNWAGSEGWGGRAVLDGWEGSEAKGVLW